MKGFIIDYVNENEFRKLERALRKINQPALKKLKFDIIPSLRKGEFLGELVSSDYKDFNLFSAGPIFHKVETYELKLPSDSLFTQVHGEVKLKYVVYKDNQVVMLETIMPSDDILLEASVAKVPFTVQYKDEIEKANNFFSAREPNFNNNYNNTNINSFNQKCAKLNQLMDIYKKKILTSEEFISEKKKLLDIEVIYNNKYEDLITLKKYLDDKKINLEEFLKERTMIMNNAPINIKDKYKALEKLFEVYNSKLMTDSEFKKEKETILDMPINN